MLYKNHCWLCIVWNLPLSIFPSSFICMGYSNVAERLKCAVSFGENRSQFPDHLLVKVTLDKPLKLVQFLHLQNTVINKGVVYFHMTVVRIK